MAHDGEVAERRHKARQVRARIVELAGEYKEACAQHEDVATRVWEAQTLADRLPLLEHERRVWNLMQQAREALFGALEELEMWEEEGSHGSG